VSALHRDRYTNVIVFYLYSGKIAIKGHLTLQVNSGGERILSISSR
jgi:hypothetical protein